MSSRKGPRGVVRALLGEMSAIIGGQRGPWVKIHMTVHEEGVGWRPRRDDEKPENDPDRWLVLYREACALVVKAEQLRDHARHQHRLAKEWRARRQ